MSYPLSWPNPVVDAQLHEPTVSAQWDDADENTRRLVLVELTLAYMRAVGVDRAALFPIDIVWAREACRLFPDRFGIVPMIAPGGGSALGILDPDAPDIEDRIEEYAADATVIGMRLLPAVPTVDRTHAVVAADAFARVVAACERARLPLFIYTLDHAAIATIARRHPDLRLIVDHLGLPQPPVSKPDSPPFASLPNLLDLAPLPNVAVKVSALPTLSQERFPFDDLIPQLRAVIGAFGPDRVMWASDISRVSGRAGFLWQIPGAKGSYPGRHTYAEGLLYLRESSDLAADVKAKILGGTALSMLRWPTP